MKEDWNDELRRAYQRGYWDARRELQSDESAGRGRTSNRDEESRREAFSERQRNRGWTPEWAEERRREWQGQQQQTRERGREGESAYRPGWRDREESYQRGWNSEPRERHGWSHESHEDRLHNRDDDRRTESGSRHEGSHGLSSADYDISGYGSSEDQWSGRTVNRYEERHPTDLRGQRDYEPGQRRDLRELRSESRERRDRSRNDDHGFFERAGDEIRSWFSDDHEERRRR